MTGGGGAATVVTDVLRARWRTLAALAVVGIVLWRVGTGPVIAGVRSVDLPAVGLAALLALGTTLCCAWRWRVVATGLGLDVRIPAAVAAYYRSQFLNTTLPGGVVGDVHRGVAHGRGAGDVGLGLRSVGWERVAGQVVQIVVTVAALAVLPSPLRDSLPRTATLLAVLAVGVAVAVALLPRGGDSRVARLRRRVSADIRTGLLPARAWPAVVVASVLVVAGHTATFVVAARVSGADRDASTLVALALVVLLVSALPLSVAGWGPREGAAAWAFAAAGLGAAQGVSAAAAYAVLVLVGTAPGAVLLLSGRIRRHTRSMDAAAHEQVVA